MPRVHVKVVGRILALQMVLLTEIEDARPYFRRMKQLFDEVKSYDIPNVEMKILSMGMSNSYEVAIEEGSNMVRIGTKLFGPRKH